MTIEDLLREPASLDDVINTLHELRSNLQEHEHEWQNITLDHYLESMARWLRDVRGRVGTEASWRLLIQLLIAGKYYE
jgi:hypothetical protein